ncbi:hypothetical protein FVE85_6155 [Porphyridium purpureum]|uniref:Glycosyltransferase family 92 protein n=1 Tax=Porphyridium purpureum TaxID=35688 RepID=A0A5J4Z5Q0_PORPP|nr:hypothetical protein FVE85_6155 [Porphyridium purpureum]|eukprot:POR3014..scf295_1
MGGASRVRWFGRKHAEDGLERWKDARYGPRADEEYCDANDIADADADTDASLSESSSSPESHLRKLSVKPKAAAFVVFLMALSSFRVAPLLVFRQSRAQHQTLSLALLLDRANSSDHRAASVPEAILGQPENATMNAPLRPAQPVLQANCRGNVCDHERRQKVQAVHDKRLVRPIAPGLAKSRNQEERVVGAAGANKSFVLNGAKAGSDLHLTSVPAPSSAPLPAPSSAPLPSSFTAGLPRNNRTGENEEEILGQVNARADEVIANERADGTDLNTFDTHVGASAKLQTKKRNGWRNTGSSEPDCVELDGKEYFHPFHASCMMDYSSINELNARGPILRWSVGGSSRFVYISQAYLARQSNRSALWMSVHLLVRHIGPVRTHEKSGRVDELPLKVRILSAPRPEGAQNETSTDPEQERDLVAEVTCSIRSQAPVHHMQASSPVPWETLFWYECSSMKLGPFFEKRVALRAELDIDYQEELRAMHADFATGLPSAPFFLCEWESTSFLPPPQPQKFILSTLVDPQDFHASAANRSAAEDKLARMRAWLLYHIGLGFHGIIVYLDNGTCRGAIQSMIDGLFMAGQIMCRSAPRLRGMTYQNNTELFRASRWRHEQILYSMQIIRFRHVVKYMVFLRPSELLAISAKRDLNDLSLSALDHLEKHWLPEPSAEDSGNECGFIVDQMVLDVDAQGEMETFEEVFGEVAAEARVPLIFRADRVDMCARIPSHRADNRTLRCSTRRLPKANGALVLRFGRDISEREPRLRKLSSSEPTLGMDALELELHKTPLFMPLAVGESSQSKPSGKQKLMVHIFPDEQPLGFSPREDVEFDLRALSAAAKAGALQRKAMKMKGPKDAFGYRAWLPDMAVHENARVRVESSAWSWNTSSSCSNPGSIAQKYALMRWGAQDYIVDVDGVSALPAQEPRNVFLLDAYLVWVGDASGDEYGTESWGEYSAHFLVKYRGEFQKFSESWLNQGLPFRIGWSSVPLDDSQGRDEERSVACRLDPPPSDYNGEYDIMSETWYGYHCDTVLIDKKQPARLYNVTLYLDESEHERLFFLEPSLQINSVRELTLCEWDPDVRMTSLEGTSEDNRYALVTMIAPTWALKTHDGVWQPSSLERLPEWLAYHFSIGFQHATVYVDGSRNDMLRVLAELNRFVRTGRVQVLPSFRNRIIWERPQKWMNLPPPAPLKLLRKRDHQRTVFATHVDRFARFHEVLFFADVDELLILRPTSSPSAQVQADDAERTTHFKSELDEFLHLQWLENEQSRIRKACQLRFAWRNYEITLSMDDANAVEITGNVSSESESSKEALVFGKFKHRRERALWPWRSDSGYRGSSKALTLARSTTFYANQHGAYKYTAPCKDAYWHPSSGHIAHFRYAKSAIQDNPLVRYDQEPILEAIRAGLERFPEKR